MEIGNEFKEIWKKHHPLKSEEGKFILDSFIVNLKYCSKIYFRNYYLLLILSLTYYCLDSKLIDHLEIFSATIKNMTILKWTILPVFCFIFYQGLSAFINETLYRHAIWNAINNIIPELTNRELEKMLYEPSIVNFEFFQASKYNNPIARIYGILFFFCILLIPLFSLFHIINQNINDWNNINSKVFKWMIILISLLLIIRIFSLVYSTLKSILK